MANGLSDATITAVLDHLVGGTPYTAPTGLVLQLHKSDPHAGLDEVDDLVDDTAYAEQSISFEPAGTTTAGRAYNDTAPVTFDPVVYGTGGPSSYTVSHWAVVDGLGALIAAGALPTPIERLTGEPLTFAIGAIYIELTRAV